MLSGQLVNLVNISQNLGILAVYLCGWFLHWRILCWTMLGMNVLAIVTAAVLPESPIYLLSKDQGSQAKKVLHKLHPRNETEVKEILDSFASKEESLSLRDTLTSQVFWKPFATVVLLQLLALSSGCMTMIMYMVNIFEASGTTIDPYESSVIAMSLKTLVSCLAYLPVKKISRRSLFISSGLVMAASFALVATLHIFTASSNSSQASIINSYTPVIALAVVYIAYALGFEPVLRLLSTEYFPGKVRSIASGISFILNSFLLAGMGQAFPYALETIGIHGTFTIFASNAAISCIYCFLFLPEAQGKTLAEMETHFKDSHWFQLAFTKPAVTGDVEKQDEKKIDKTVQES